MLLEKIHLEIVRIPIHTRLLALFLLSVPTATAQPKGADSLRQARGLDTFVDRVDVRVVNVEAVVVDRDGNRVIGLSSEDFSLRVDGKDIPIGFFSEVRNGHGVAASPAREPDASSTPDHPPSPEVDLGRLAPNQPIRTSYLLFIDNYFTSRASQRNRILDGIEIDLGFMGPEDHMAIVAFDGRRPEMLTTWSNSSEEIRDALLKARSMPARGFITTAPGRELRSSLPTDPIDGAGVAGSARPDGLASDICASIRRLERRIERTVLGVTSTLRSFAKPPGRKVMMILSGGWPHSIKDYLTGGPGGGTTAGALLPAGDCSASGARIYKPIYETANLLGYTIYPVDVPRPPGPAISAANSGRHLFDAGQRSPQEIQLNSEFELKSTLQTLATQTGGRAMIGGDAFGALAAVADDLRSYYWLGFTPPWKGDDSSHKIKLSVNQPGLKVRTRKGFQDLSRQTEVTFVTESALMFGSLPGAYPLGLEFGQRKNAGRGKVEISLRLTIPMDAVTMLPWKGRYQAELELRIAVLNERGERNEIPTIFVPMEGTEPPRPGAHSIYETSIKIRRENHVIVVSLYDPIGDTILATSGRVTF